MNEPDFHGHGDLGRDILLLDLVVLEGTDLPVVVFLHVQHPTDRVIREKVKLFIQQGIMLISYQALK